MRPSIVHVYKDYAPILGGIENHIRLLAEAQVARGHAVTVLVTNPAGLHTTQTVEAGVRVIRAGRMATVASTPLSFALGWQLARLRADVVHLHFPYPLGEISQLLLRRGSITILSYHSDVVRQAKVMSFYGPVLQRLLARVDAILVASPPMRASRYLVNHQAKLHLIPYGIPLQRFIAKPGSDQLQAMERSYPGTARAGGSHLLLFVGRLRYYKGLDTLIRCLPFLADTRLLVVGSGQMGPAWSALAKETGVAARIDWLGDVPDAMLAALYHRADLLVLPASHPSEAFGLVQVEAMATGLPVVSTELGTGTSYVNCHNVTGRVVPPRDPASLAKVISELLADPAERARLGAGGRARALAEFDLDRMVERVERLYTELMERV